jgi:5-methylcytosine-specific restriction enzyme B
MADALGQLVAGMQQGLDWDLMGQKAAVQGLLGDVLADRLVAYDHGTYQTRVNLQTKEGAASYAGFITAEDNPTSGPYQGTSFVWFPGKGGSVAVLVIGTDGFGADAAILERPGHARRLRALARLHGGRVWVKPDLLDLSSQVPDALFGGWPAIEPARRAYSSVVYAAVPVTEGGKDPVQPVADLLDLFFYEHRSRYKAAAQAAWVERLQALHAHVFPRVHEAEVVDLLKTRRFVILEGPPGTGKTRLATRVGAAVGDHDMVQFHPARTYEDFVIGLYPRVAGSELAFEVRAGDLLRANARAQNGAYTLIIDEINRADLGRVLGEAVSLLEPGEEERTVRLPHKADEHPEDLRLSPNLFVLGTRNTADRSIARMDLAIRRRFAFIDVWPELEVVKAQGVEIATDVFEEVLQTFIEFASDEALRLVPGHAYFLDPRPNLPAESREIRIRHRLEQELVPLLRDYVSERLLGAATMEIAGLADRIEARTREP